MVHVSHKYAVCALVKKKKEVFFHVLFHIGELCSTIKWFFFDRQHIICAIWRYLNKVCLLFIINVKDLNR